MDIFRKYIAENPYYLTQHSIDSFDTFTLDGIKKAILEKEHPVRVLKKKDKLSTTFTHRINLYFGGRSGDEFYYEKPSQYPNTCRLEGIDYYGTLKIKVLVEIIQDENLLSENVFDVDFLKIPTMLHSKSCLLRGMSKGELHAKGECPYEQGGYFIIGGLEKVIVSQERNLLNNIQTMYAPDEYPFTYKSYVKSREEGSAQIPQSTYLKLNEDTGGLWILVPFVKKMVPVCLVMRALGIETDKDMMNIICGDINTESGKLIASLIRPSISEGGILYNQEAALRYLATLTKVQPEKGNVKWKENILYILTRRLFPHSNRESTKLLYKAFYLSHMIRNILLTKQGYYKVTDKDAFSQRQFHTGGDLLTDIFRDFYSEYIDDVRSKLYKRFEYKKEYREKFKNILIDANSKPIFDATNFQARLDKSFRGRWGKNPNAEENLGVVQDLQRLSYLGSISHLRRTHLYLPETAKLVQPRRLHGSQWGYICPIETPDGGNVSQLKHISIMVRYSDSLVSEALYPIFFILGMISIVDMNKTNHNYHKVIVNGHWAGVVSEPDVFTNILKDLRRTKLIHYSISITWKISIKEIRICTLGGRLLRPLFIAKNYDIKKITSQKWSELSQEYTNDVIDNKFFIKISKKNPLNDLIDKVSKRTKSIIEYVDPSESDTIYVAMNPSEVKNHTHIELHPSLILGTTALTLPFLEHNPSPRNLFAVGQCKQAVSTYVSNFRNRMDQTASILFYGQKPLVHAGYLDIINKNKFCYGINAIVAIGTFTGYNQEDSIILNKTSVERGMFLSSYTKTHSLREESSFMNTMKICNPLKSSKLILNLKPGYDYSLLDDNGVIKVNSIVKANTILIGACIKNESGDWIDSSLTYGMAHEHEVVRKVYLSDWVETSSDLGNIPRIAKVMTSEIRIPIVGDKFAARSAQKGTVGLLVEHCNMPYTEDGIVPDIVINPHAFPSRMTMGYFLEMISGLFGIEAGGLINASAFHGNVNIDELILNLLDKIGINHKGEYVMFNGITGKKTCANVSMGPVFYQRLKQMVSDKIYARGSGGPKDMLTKQPLHGRARGGGLRNGEMERDVLLSHGISQFSKETYYERADAYQTYVSNTSSDFVPPQTENAKKVQIPYAFKLLNQEARTIGVKMILDT